MAAITKLYTLCSLLMASLFAYSASVQLNDPDWYFWFPLYFGACFVNLVIWAVSSKAIKQVAEAALWLGIFLFIKVTAESASLKASKSSLAKALLQQSYYPTYVKYGMAVLVGFSFGLPFVFFVVQKGEMKL
ncbi:uncharacterized protein [Malus domestica]|uniref:uncharacterized protein isoform X2 n=1 Tax=Malus domestica TaxID=3750 RepID=UPI0007ECDD14